jgi:F-type H+-transporting ATPase subunit a
VGQPVDSRAAGQGREGYVTRGSLAGVIEALCAFLRDSMARPLLGNLTDKYIYYIWSTFFFILIANVLGLIPFGSIFGLLFGEHASHFGGTLTGNLAFTGGLAILAFLLIHGISLYEQGLGYLKHGFPVPMKPMATKPMFRLIEWCTLVPLLFIVNILVGFLELVLGPVIKAFALAMRLFANMVAGHLVLGSLIILVLTAGALGKGFGVFGAAAFSFLELFVAFLQAYVFTFLTVIFISMGAAHHDEHHEEGPCPRRSGAW